MGEVYRARDTRLDRTVAVKVLPKQFQSDPDLKARSTAKPDPSHRSSTQMSARSSTSVIRTESITS
jgi:serine/threonine protein kinase